MKPDRFHNLGVRDCGVSDDSPNLTASSLNSDVYFVLLLILFSFPFFNLLYGILVHDQNAPYLHFATLFLEGS